MIVKYLIVISIINVCDSYQEYDYPKLKPEEILNLIRISMETSSHKNAHRAADIAKMPIISSDSEMDEAPSPNHKIWSRWSKWSQCSVTCGTGSIMRQRQCVSGHCAPGEFEEQRRPCEKTPCKRYRDSTDD